MVAAEVSFLSVVGAVAVKLCRPAQAGVEGKSCEDGRCSRSSSSRSSSSSRGSRHGKSREATLDDGGSTTASSSSNCSMQRLLDDLLETPPRTRTTSLRAHAPRPPISAGMSRSSFESIAEQSVVFVCSGCTRCISEDEPVHMCGDAAYCSRECRSTALIRQSIPDDFPDRHENAHWPEDSLFCRDGQEDACWPEDSYLCRDRCLSSRCSFFRSESAASLAVLLLNDQ